MRGYFGIGVYNIKHKCNLGTLLRSAYIFGASFVFVIGKRFKKQASDTIKSYRHIPLFQYKNMEEWKENIPYDCIPICVEISNKAIKLNKFIHPERAIYLLGAEDHGLPEKILKDYQTIIIPTHRDFCLNVATAGSVIMYDRYINSQG